MRTLVAVAILLLVLLLAGLVAYILLRRAGDRLLSAYRDRRRNTLGQAVESWLASEPETLPPLLENLRPFVDRGLLTDMLLGRLEDADDGNRARILRWLENRGLVDEWMAELSAGSPWKRASAAERLAIVKAPTSVDALVGALDDPVLDVRMRAARALGATGGRQARRALVGALADENRWSVIRITDLLREMGPEVVGELVDGFPQMGRASRLATLDLIAHIGDSSVTSFLVEQLDDLDRDVRARTASALGRIGDARAIPQLIPALQDAEWPVRAMAAKALGELRGVDACDALVASLRDREWWVRANAAEALRKMGDPGLERLTAALDDHDRFARDQALAALEAAGEMARRLAPLASDDPGRRQEARDLLRVLVARQPRGRIQALLERQKDPQLRAAVGAELSAWEPAREERP
jgi:HEAT repeat protein